MLHWLSYFNFNAPVMNHCKSPFEGHVPPATWNAAAIPFGRLDLALWRAIDAWLDDHNLETIWTLGDGDDPLPVYFWFEKPEQAVLFKLAFG